jgi:hypothetical protein
MARRYGEGGAAARKGPGCRSLPKSSVGLQGPSRSVVPEGWAERRRGNSKVTHASVVRDTVEKDGL